MRVDLREATLDERPVLATLLELYRHDFKQASR
jgi:hypothetical protein